MVAEVALSGYVFLLLEGNGAEGTGVQASSAAGALHCLQNDYPVRPLENGLDRTDVSARGVVAVPAQGDSESELEHSGHPFWAVFPNRDELDPVGSLVLLLAGHLAGPAAPATLLIDSQNMRGHGFDFQSASPQPAKGIAYMA